MEAEAIARKVWMRLLALGEVSDEFGGLTRIFGGPGMREAAGLLRGWMGEAGLEPVVDAWGNVFGRAPGGDGLPLVVLGSHFDTVRNAGRFDGALGVMAGLACAEILRAEASDLPFRLEVAAFADEEGARFQTAYLGSRGALGLMREEDLERRGADGVALRDLLRPDVLQQPARYRRSRVLAYLEAHIEQGPQLEALGQPLGVATHIAGQSRLRAGFRGQAAHAGTCPMPMRRDALAGAAEFVLATEREAHSCPGLVATVGVLDIPQAAPNVVPGEVRFTLDVRHAEDAVRVESVARLKECAQELAAVRDLALDWQIVQETEAVRCDPGVTAALSAAISPNGQRVPKLVSGAGHDAVTLSLVTGVGLLFVRCKGGLSHHPEEMVAESDFVQCVDALVRAVRKLAGLPS